MKKVLSVLALLAIVITMVSCTSGKNPIAYGKKYFHSVRSDEQYYVFKRDHTGYCEYYSHSNATISGRVEFVWREASDGAIYLFKTKTTYYENRGGGTIPLLTGPIYFSKEFFVYHSGDGSVRYVKEGSKLEKLIKN